ncbi:hypothetical protein FNYG_14602 [Fusarium nygamai]|uniref:F-box domain-containing protein n=1 Tax=Gibberella nygamai TaxID=42673 RepID=A0A2K0USC6_GIBNY|nr:hypothetical protein FNYG_14602 [Fusarium nygamai]
MAGSSTTPALATMPTEIVCMIGAHLSIYVIKAWTLVSKRFRNIFLSQICKHIKFSGNMEQLENNILSYFRTATASFRNVVHHNIRCVTFDVQPFNNPWSLRAWARVVRHSPIRLSQIGQFMISNPNIHRVAFNTDFGERMKEIRLFVKLVEAGPRWPNVKNLSIQSPEMHGGLTRAVVRKLEQGALRTLSTYSNFFFTTAGTMPGPWFANVTSLSLRRQARKDWLWVSPFSDSVIAGLDADLLTQIHTSFPKLESLVLYDGILDDRSGNGPLANSTIVVLVIMDAVSTLKKMQSLRRFAFDFDKSRLDPNAISVLEQAPSAFNKMIRDKFEDDAVAECILLSLLASHVSTLEEICMTSQYPDFYRVTRRDGELDIGRDSFDDPSQKYLFSSALMG